MLSELTVQNMYGLLLRSKLLSLENARAMFDRWQKEAKENYSNLAKFASWMVANRYVTEYQATLLARGHADGFFLGDYKILDRLGKGRMAGVYKAQHPLGQVFALKVLPPSKARDPQMMARFQREVQMALKLKHPNVVRAFQTGKGGELHYLVMEYLEGETLEEHLARRKKLPPAEAVRLVYQALQGLQHIHSQGLVHRDLKPANLMLATPPGTPTDNTLKATIKILDIGLGRALFDEGAVDQPMTPGLTMEGVVLGTPDYMAPEQASDPRKTDIRADIYSLGCVLYHLLSGQPPFKDTNFISQMIRHAKEPAKPLKQFNPAIPDGLQQIVNWMMAKDPAQRYPTPERAAQALQVFLAAGGDVMPMPEADPKMKTYMTWLDTRSAPVAQPVPAVPTGRQPSPTPAAVAAPAAVPVQPPPVPGTQPSAITNEKPTKPGKKKQGRQAAARRRKKQQQIAARKAKRAAQEFDVELVPLSALPNPQPTQRTYWFQMNRREVILFGIGVVAGAIATAIGLLLARGGS